MANVKRNYMECGAIGAGFVFVSRLTADGAGSDNRRVATSAGRFDGTDMRHDAARTADVARGAVFSGRLAFRYSLANERPANRTPLQRCTQHTATNGANAHV